MKSDIVGKEVKIIAGSFEGMNGTVIAVDSEAPIVEVKVDKRTAISTTLDNVKEWEG